MESKEYAYKQGNEGEDILLDVHWNASTPQDSSSTGHPIVMIFHGGGFVQGSKSIIPRIQIEELVRLGFVVVVPNFRLCPQISVFEGPVTDAKDCLRWVESSLGDVLHDEKNGLPVDQSRIVTMGHSCGATLALLQAGSSTSVIATLDFYGGKYFRDSCWHEPSQSALFLSAPYYPESLTEQIYSGPQISTATPVFGTPDLPPRDAWLSNAFKSGRHLELVVKDGDFDRVDPKSRFSGTFPPAMFIHGTDDTVTPLSISERAYEELKGLGVKTQILRIQGADHMFDMLYTSPEEDYFKKNVSQGLEFLAREAGL
ncbi:Alpha/Beta hydrolase protein [Talaromyces proteolyticus]|uniref:Alpha/Beta hydrolase protein n=1 Tax=Talaromyces proteolyticus TaxID=1131652 RepID=A0AAD4KPE1_9EURO|nr:Alpha/Beta hydrolase protein [Talaromyces proteolyticus]KAH8696123.1 Alpha/Beta hydrolase protein [Talaromyces proteolyticus]